MKIVDQARPLVAVLKDAGRQHSAEPLAALYFELDAASEEAAEAAHVNPQVLREVLMQAITGR
jgi:hypothetical protein